ncbi:TPA: sulfurtransferase complex subunit TusB [Pluralibacter gergoviae]|uniref:Protein TusB n=1 Tax=Pluralibacter gergoviae TaxID=61647 RepID=A0A0J5LPW0_PLUGE|nr:sulfurtransferase complex subunit TusB [Pluralibacter gergoviae]KMK12054.1 sulfur transfer complex subunit TusB [Pluralibacter gergoviae]KMK21758.1 sulfur transfer complex subunit TusB [Pluralibacter gergoviae]MBL3693269.1 sulfurtransferase complex subunit TusB [Pluralibacter gergoviae]HDS1154220.1 sulfurtransferase complex subunit TusB [Pluralibacter gergoviae]
MLHTLNYSPWHRDILAPLRLAQPGDDLLLLSDGVIAALQGGPFLDLLRAAPIMLYALSEDIEARGLAAQISDSVVRVSYTDFVRLTAKHDAQYSW